MRGVAGGSQPFANKLMFENSNRLATEPPPLPPAACALLKFCTKLSTLCSHTTCCGALAWNRFQQKEASKKKAKLRRTTFKGPVLRYHSKTVKLDDGAKEARNFLSFSEADQFLALYFPGASTAQKGGKPSRAKAKARSFTAFAPPGMVQAGQTTVLSSVAAADSTVAAAAAAAAEAAATASAAAAAAEAAAAAAAAVGVR